MGVRLFLPNVRLSYPTLFVPKHYKNNPASTPRFGAQVMVPVNAPVYPANQIPGNSLVEQIWNARHKIVQEEKRGVAPAPQHELVFRDGALTAQTSPEYVGYWVLSANATTQPHVVDENVQPIIDHSKIYPGCVANVSVTIYANKEGGISAGLDGVQFVRDGERLDNRPAAGDLFQAIPGAPAPVATPPGYQPGVMGSPAQPPGYNQSYPPPAQAPMMGVPGQAAPPAAPQQFPGQPQQYPGQPQQYPGPANDQGWTP